LKLGEKSAEISIIFDEVLRKIIKFIKNKFKKKSNDKLKKKFAEL